jgi:alanyl aminopeptidase
MYFRSVQLQIALIDLQIMLRLTSGDVEHQLTAAERYDVIGNAGDMAAGGRMSAADALRLVESFSRQVLQRALTLALSFGRDVVPDDLRPNYQRFLLKSFQVRARELGWIPKPGESEDVMLVRPALLKAVAPFGGDEELARPARGLTDKWLVDRKAVAQDVVDCVVATAAYYGDVALYQRFLAELQQTQDRQGHRSLLEAMIQFRDPRRFSWECVICWPAKFPGHSKIAVRFHQGALR